MASDAGEIPAEEKKAIEVSYREADEKEDN